MSKNKHTPGPWKAHAYTDSGNVYIKEGNQGFAIAQMLDTYPDQMQANARLMAAAPALLEALDWIVYEIVEGCEDKDAILRVAQEAIAKAKGEVK